MLQLVGSAKELGHWDTKKGVNFEWNEGNVWKLEIVSPACGYFEYKIIAFNTMNDSVLWEPCQNRILEPLDTDLEVSLTWGEQEALVSPKPRTVFINNIAETSIDLWLGRREQDSVEDSSEFDDLDDLHDLPPDFGQSSIAPGNDLLKNATQIVPELDDILEDETDKPEVVAEDMDVTKDMDANTLSVTNDQDEDTEDSDSQSATEDYSPEEKKLSTRGFINESNPSHEPSLISNELAKDNSGSTEVCLEAQNSSSSAIDIPTKNSENPEDPPEGDMSLEVCPGPISNPNIGGQDSKIGSSDQSAFLVEQEGEQSIKKSLTPPDSILELSTNQENKETGDATLSGPQDLPADHVGIMEDDREPWEGSVHETMDVRPTLASDTVFTKSFDLAFRASKLESKELQDKKTNEAAPLKLEVGTSLDHNDSVSTIAGDDGCTDPVLEMPENMTFEESNGTTETYGTSSDCGGDKPPHAEIAQMASITDNVNSLEATGVAPLDANAEATSMEPCGNSRSREESSGGIIPSSIAAAIANSSSALASIGLKNVDALADGLFVGFGFVLSMGAPMAKSSFQKATNSSTDAKQTTELSPSSKIRTPEAPGLFLLAMMSLAAEATFKLLHQREESDKPGE